MSDIDERLRQLDRMPVPDLRERIGNPPYGGRDVGRRLGPRPKHRTGIEPTAGGRNRRRVAWALAAAAIVVPALVLGQFATGGGGTITLDARDALRDPDAMVVRLASAGIDAEIFTVPTRDQEGDWIEVALDRPRALPESAWDDLLWSGPRLEIPRGIEGPVKLFVGRSPRSGEEVNRGVGSNDLAPTGDFWCLALESMTPQEATLILEQLGWEVDWELSEIGEIGDGVVEVSVVDELPPGAELVRAETIQPTRVLFSLTPGPGADSERRSWGTPSEAHPRSTWSSWAPPCASSDTTG